MKPESLRIAVAADAKLHVRAWPGDPGRRPFLLVHGLSSNARLWDGVAAVLSAAGHPAYAVDLRSHGESDRPATGYDTATAAADLDAVVRRPRPAAGARRRAVLGRQRGRPAGRPLPDPGRLARAGRRRLDRAARAASRRGRRAPSGCARRTWTAWPPARLRNYLRHGHPDWAPWAIDATLANFRVDADGKLERRLPIPEHMQILRSMWDDPPQPYYPDVHVPVLLVPAGDKTVDPTGLADAEVRAYPGADHDLHAQHPEALARDLLSRA